jgi:large subunit ribosomal protein L17
MRKKRKGRKFSRKTGPRKALIKSLLSELFLHERITTTEAKAREIKPRAEKIITKAREDSLGRRRLIAKDFSPVIVKKIFEDIAPRFKERPGGYTRIIKLPPRKSDAAKMAIIELVTKKEPKKK